MIVFLRLYFHHLEIVIKVAIYETTVLVFDLQDSIISTVQTVVVVVVGRPCHLPILDTHTLFLLSSRLLPGKTVHRQDHRSVLRKDLDRGRATWTD